MKWRGSSSRLDRRVLDKIAAEALESLGKR